MKNLKNTFMDVKAFLRQNLPHWIVYILYNSYIFLKKGRGFNIEKNRKRQDMFSYKEFYDFVMDNYDFTTFVEVGVWKGHGVIYLAKSLKNRGVDRAKIIAVDLFDDIKIYQGTLYRKDAENLMKMFDKNIKEAGVEKTVKKIKGVSWEMAKNIKNKSVDLVFIDAGHSYDEVKKDIKAYFPKIKKGGIMSGHDALNKNVLSAVHDYFGKDNVEVIKRADTWYVMV